MAAAVHKGSVQFDGAVTLAAGEIVTADIADLAVTTAKINDLGVTTGKIADAAITPVKLSSTALSPAADAAVAILNTTTEINVTVTAAGNVAISTTSSVAGQTLFIRATSVAGGGSYTLAVTGGTLTINSTGELAVVQRNAANNAWIVLALTASSSTAANVATIV